MSKPRCALLSLAALAGSHTRRIRYRRSRGHSERIPRKSTNTSCPASNWDMEEEWVLINVQCDQIRELESGSNCRLIPNRNATLDFWIEVKEGIDAAAQLGLDLFAGAFQNVHRHPRLVPVFELHGCIPHLGDLLRGKEAQTIDQRKIRHAAHLMRQSSMEERSCLNKSRHRRDSLPRIVCRVGESDTSQVCIPSVGFLRFRFASPAITI